MNFIRYIYRTKLIFVVLFLLMFLLVGCEEMPSTNDPDYDERIYAIYELALESQAFEGTYEEWLNSVQGPQGEQGEKIQLQINDTFIVWKYESDENWSELISLSALTGSKGEQGDSGKTPIFQVDNDYIQWKYVGDQEWLNLLSLDILIEDIQDELSTPKEVEFRNSGTYIQWRHVGDETWTDLVDVLSLKGEKGDKGDTGEDGVSIISVELNQSGELIIEFSNGESINVGVVVGEDGLTPHIGENNNWWIGDYDTGVLASSTNVNMDRVGTDGLYFDLTIRNGIAGYEVVSYSGTNTDIIIPNEVFGQKVISIKQGALPTSITSLSISKYTEVLPSFQNYNKLISFDFNKAPVSMIPDYAFNNATSLSTVTNYENIKTIGAYGFNNTKILFNDFNFSNITHIGTYAFYVSSVPNLDVEGVIIKVENNMITISDQTFIYLPATVQSIGFRAFPLEFSIYYAGNVEVDFTSEFFFKNVKKTEDNYWYVDRNTYVGLLNYTGELTEVTVPNKLDGKNVNVVENYAFIGDNNLSRIDLPNTVTSIGNYSFILMRKLYVLHIPSSIVNISNSYFASWSISNDLFYHMNFPATLVVFENNQADMNFGGNDVSDYGWGRYAFGYTSSQIKQDSSFVYVEKTLTAEILAIKNTASKVTIPALYNLKPVTRINSYSLIGGNGGVTFIDISQGVQYISTNAFYRSSTVRFINVPSSVSAVNYQGFYMLDRAEIHVKDATKPDNWDSNWYYQVSNIIWDSKFTGNVSSDGLYVYTLSGSSAIITKYLGTWSSSYPLIIPNKIDGLNVSRINSQAIRYTSSSTTLEIVLPNTMLTIEENAIYYYRYLTVYSYSNEKPYGWADNFGYNNYYNNSTDSYRTYYWNGTWVLTNGDPNPS